MIAKKGRRKAFEELYGKKEKVKRIRTVTRVVNKTTISTWSRVSM